MDVDFIAIAAIVGVLLPVVVSFLKVSTWSTTVKKTFAMVLAIIAAVITTGVDLGWAQLTWQNLLASAAIIIPLAQTTYLGFWEDTGLDTRLSSLRILSSS